MYKQIKKGNVSEFIQIPSSVHQQRDKMHIRLKFLIQHYENVNIKLQTLFISLKVGRICRTLS